MVPVYRHAKPILPLLARPDQNLYLAEWPTTSELNQRRCHLRACQSDVHQLSILVGILAN